MNACSLTEKLSLDDEVPSEVQEIIITLLEKSETGGVFGECKMIPPVGKCSSCENHVFVNPWNGGGIQFRTCFKGEERHFRFVSRGDISREKQNRVYSALQSAADFIFLGERKKISKIPQSQTFIQRANKPDFRMVKQKPKEEIMAAQPIAELSELLATPSPLVEETVMTTVVSQEAGRNTVPNKQSPKKSLTDICKKILAAIETGNVPLGNVPKQFLSDVIEDFFAPSPPGVLKGLVGPTFNLLRGQKIIAPQYDESQKPLKSGYRLPIAYSIDISVLKMYTEGEIALKAARYEYKPRKKKNTDAVASVVSIHNEAQPFHFGEELGKVDTALKSIEQSIKIMEQELGTLKTKRILLQEVQNCLAKTIDGLKKLG